MNAPGPASAILAGVLLEMGTYGLIRIPYSMLSAAFSRYALALGIVAVVAILWGALVAMAQRDLKRRIAYMSINHMGYTLLGIAAAGALVGGDQAARQMALTGATVEMIAHGLITGALFLICGAFWQRAREYDLGAYGGLAQVAPHLTGFAVLASFASLGLPGLAGFVAELQIFVGAFGVFPWLAAIGLVGILITAALFLFLAAYAAANLAAFAVVTQLRGRTNLDGYRGLALARAAIAAALVVSFLSLVGIPPLAGFAGKLMLFLATVQAGYAWLAIVAVINTVVSLVYYLRVLAPVYFGSVDKPVMVLGRWAAGGVYVATLLTIGLGIAAEMLWSMLGPAGLLP